MIILSLSSSSLPGPPVALGGDIVFPPPPKAAQLAVGGVRVCVVGCATFNIRCLRALNALHVKRRIKFECLVITGYYDDASEEKGERDTERMRAQDPDVIESCMIQGAPCRPSPGSGCTRWTVSRVPLQGQLHALEAHACRNSRCGSASGLHAERSRLLTGKLFSSVVHAWPVQMWSTSRWSLRAVARAHAHCP